MAKWNAAADKTEKQEEAITNIMKELEEMERIRENLQQVNQKLNECVTQDEIKPTINAVNTLKEDMNMAQ